MDEKIKEQIRFVLEDDNEGMRAGIERHSDLDAESKQMNHDLIERHRRILAKLDRGESLSQEDLVLIRDANEIHLNDEDNLNGHHAEAIELNDWLDHMMELSIDEAMKVLEEHLDKDPKTPVKVYRALHTLWEEATLDDVGEQPAFDKTGKCLTCGSRVSLADATDTIVFVGDDIVGTHEGDMTNRNCIRCTYPDLYPDYAECDKEAD